MDLICFLSIIRAPCYFIDPPNPDCRQRLPWTRRTQCVPLHLLTGENLAFAKCQAMKNDDSAVLRFTGLWKRSSYIKLWKHELLEINRNTMTTAPIRYPPLNKRFTETVVEVFWSFKQLLTHNVLKEVLMQKKIICEGHIITLLLCINVKA